MKLLTTEEFISKAHQAHNNKYSYENTVYKNSRTNISITCPVHGEFLQLAGRHLQGHGCSKCKYDKISNNKTTSLDKFLAKLQEKDYRHIEFNHTNFKGMTTPIEFTCTKHGNFTIVPWRILNNVKGCHMCGHEEACRPARTNLTDLIEKCDKVHGHKYDYSSVEFTKMKKLHTIICPIHGEFQQTLSSHLAGRGCPSCAYGGFDPKKPGHVYYLAINNGEAYKIGITNRTVEERFNLTELSKIEVVWTKYFENGQDCWDMEKEILRKYKQYRYKGNPLLVSGNTELFSVDIFNLPQEV